MSTTYFDEWLYKKYYSTSCHFCDLNLGDEGCAIELEFYKNHTFQKQISRIKIPRCKSCKDRHYKEKRNKTIIFLCSEIISVGIFVFIELTFNGIIFSAVLIGLFVGFIFGAIINIIIVPPNKNKDLKDNNKSTFLENPLVIQKIKEGWFLD